MLLFTPMSGRPPFSRLALLAAYAHLFSFISCFTLLVALRSTLHLQAVLTFTWIDCSHLPVGRQACTNPEHSPPQCRVSLLKAQGQSRTLFLPRHVQGFLVAYESARASLAGMQGPPAPTSFPFLPLLLQTISCQPGTTERPLTTPHSESFLHLCFPSQARDASQVLPLYLL